MPKIEKGPVNLERKRDNQCETFWKMFRLATHETELGQSVAPDVLDTSARADNLEKQLCYLAGNKADLIKNWGEIQVSYEITKTWITLALAMLGTASKET